MRKISVILFLATLAGTCTTFAEQLDNDFNPETVIHDNPSQLQSIPLLQSLKNINNDQEFRAPYVQDLKNHNAVRSLFVESQDLPMVDIQLTFNAGSARDLEIGQGLYGLSNMAANLMDEGTEKYNAHQIINAFEQSGAQFSIQAYRDMFIVHLRVLSDPKKLEPALSMMLEVLNHATFKNNSINLAVSNTQVGQKQLKESPSRLMSIKFYREVYGAHPYAQPITGTNGGLKKITSDDLKQFRDQFIVAQNMNIAITGKLTTKEARSLSKRISAHLKQGKKAQPLALPQPKTTLNIVHIPYDASQGHVMFGQLGTTRNDPDRLALEVANRMFGGGGFNSILMQELRIKRGYTYGAYSSFSFSQAPGAFSFSYSTRQDQLIESIKVAYQALTQFVQQPIDREQLEETKAGMLRAFPNNYSSNRAINAQLGSLGFYGHPADYLDEYPKLLEKITAEDVQNAVRKHLHPEQMTLIVVSKELNKTNLKDILLNHQQSEPLSSKDSAPLISSQPIQTIAQPKAEVDAPAQSQNDKPALTSNTAPY